MTLDAETAGIDNLTALAEYIDHFNVHYRLLLRRYKRFQEIDDIYNTDIDVITYLDMIVVQLRAMCIESPHLKSNYTAQILLRKLGESEFADRLDKMLEEPFIEVTDFTIRKALKPSLIALYAIMIILMVKNGMDGLGQRSLKSSCEIHTISTTSNILCLF